MPAPAPSTAAAFARPPGRVAEVVSVRRVFSGFLSIDEARVRHGAQGGTLRDAVRQSLERGDSAAAVLVDRARRVTWLTEQFRYPTLAQGPGWLREVPAGDRRADETPAQAAAREAFEETGFRIAHCEPVATFYTSPGGSSERIWLFYAAVDGLVPDAAGAAAARDAGEDIVLVEEPLDRFLDACRDGQVADAKTLIAGLWMLVHRERLGL